MSDIITPELKSMFNGAIDSILKEGALSIPCKLKYAGTSQTLCPNCIYDPLSKRSANKFKTSGGVPFGDGQICPVCSGRGLSQSDSEETVHLGVIFDSKYFLKWGSDTIRIPDGVIQTICSSSFIDKLKNASEIIVTVNNNLYKYTRLTEPQPAGFGDTNYILTLWQRQ
jgi:hypothetical protein